MSIALCSARISSVYRRMPLSFSRTRKLVTAKEDSSSSEKEKESKKIVSTSRRATPADFERWKDSLAEHKERQTQLKEKHITKKLT